MPQRTSNAAKRKQAKDLYCRYSLQQREIARILGVTEKTISKWKSTENWDRERAAYTTTKESELRRIYGQLANLNNEIENRTASEGQAGIPSSKEADIQSKLSSSIRTLENDAGAAATVDVAVAFTTWCKGRSIDIAPLVAGKLSFSQMVCDELDMYIKGLFR